MAARESSHQPDASPRVREEPLDDARNAIARFRQAGDLTDEERREAFNRIRRAAQRFDVEMSAERWQDPGNRAET